MGAILKVRDDEGNIIEIPALKGEPGKGDMEASVYDTEGKKQDVFQYVDDQIADHNADTSAHSDIRKLIQDSAGYTKEETLSNTTKTELGLGAEATPDDAFEKVLASATVAGDTVLDKCTGKRVTITTAVDGFTKKIVPRIYTGTLPSPSNDEYGMAEYCFGFSKGDLLRFFCTKGNGSNNYDGHMIEYNIKTGEVLWDYNIASIGSSYKLSYFLNSSNYYSCDNEVFPAYIGNSGGMVDFKYRQVVRNGLNGMVFNTPNYWGYIVANGQSSRNLFFCPRGSWTNSNNSVSLGSGQSNYRVELLGTSGDNVIYAEFSSGTSFRVCRVNLATKSVTTGIDTCDVSKFGSVSSFDFYSMLTTKTHAHIMAMFNLNNQGHRTVRPIKVDLATGMTDFSAISSCVPYAGFNPGDCRGEYYMGTVGDKVYYGYPSINYFIVWDKVTNVFEKVSMPTSHRFVRKCTVKEMVFDIKDVPNTIDCGQVWFDTSKCEFQLMPVGSEKYYSASYVTGVLQTQDNLKWCVLPMNDDGIITEVKCGGFPDSNLTEIAVMPFMRRVTAVDAHE